MRTKSRSLMAASVAAVVGLGVTSTFIGSADATNAPRYRMMALSGNGQDIATLYLNDITNERRLGKVQGLEGDTKLVGIDFRVSNGRFYGVGNAGGIYTINSANAAVNKVSQLSEDLDGTDFGVDFNPAADRLRIVSNTSQNLRHNVDAPTGATIVDGALNNGATPPVPVTGVSAAAYTNNDNSADTGTLLYDFNAETASIGSQVPANSGTLINSGKVGVPVTGVAGLDIVTIRNKAGVSVNNLAFASFRATRGGASYLYSVETQSGAATSLGKFQVSVADLAIQHP